MNKSTQLLNLLEEEEKYVSHVLVPHSGLAKDTVVSIELPTPSTRRVYTPSGKYVSTYDLRVATERTLFTKRYASRPSSEAYVDSSGDELYKGYKIKDIRRQSDTSMFSRVVGYAVYYGDELVDEFDSIRDAKKWILANPPSTRKNKSEAKLELPAELKKMGFRDMMDNAYSLELDRYRRHDHGGEPNGDGWLPDHEIQADFDRGAKQYKSTLDKVNRILASNGFKSNAKFSLGEKGHFYIDINPLEKK